MIVFTAFTDDEYWTSGSESDCPLKYFWCSKDAEFVKSQVSWKSNHPDPNFGSCVHAQIIKNDPKPIIEMGTSACNEKKRFVCEIRQTGTTTKGLTLECMALWDVTAGIYSAIKESF